MDARETDSHRVFDEGGRARLDKDCSNRARAKFFRASRGGARANAEGYPVAVIQAGPPRATCCGQHSSDARKRPLALVQLRQAELVRRSAAAAAASLGAAATRIGPLELGDPPATVELDAATRA
jgi:hypothetical protein